MIIWPKGVHQRAYAARSRIERSNPPSCAPLPPARKYALTFLGRVQLAAILQYRQ